MADFRLNVNGKDISVRADGEESLLSVLRNRLEMTGTKYGCGEGQCGACTVLLDREPVFSCITPVSVVAGRAVRTVEGLGTSDNPGPMQRAFIEEQAAQCGYCIAGMMMRAQGLLEQNPSPSSMQVRQYMSANLCRCGTHMRILRAIDRAGALMRETGTKGKTT